MIHFKLYFRTSYRKKSGDHPIYLRLNQGKKVTDITLHVSTRPECWNDDKLRITSKDPEYIAKNKKLSRAHAKAVGIIDEYERKKRYLSIEEFKRNFNDDQFGSQCFFTFAEKYIQGHSYNITAGTLKVLNDQVRKIKSFKPEVSLAEIDLAFIQRYEKYLRTVRKNNDNTVIKALRVLKQLIIRAFKDGLIQRNPFIDYPLGRIEGKRQYLTESEVSRLMNIYHSNNLNSNIRNVLRYFLFSCYTGLSYGDVYDLRKRDITTISVRGNENKFIDTTRKKTGTAVIVPLLNEAESLIPDNIYYDAQKVFRVLKNQPTNRHLKKIMELAGITKRISFHCARHTFATLCKTKGIDYDVIAKYLGHTDAKTTRIYAKYELELLTNEMNKWH